MDRSCNTAEPGYGPVLGPDCVHAAGPAGRKAMASISIFAFSNRPATCTAVLVGGSFGKNSPRMREKSGGNGTPTWPETKIQQPARVSMRSASLKLGAIGLGRCLSKSIALLPAILPVGVCTGFNRRRLSLPSTASDPVFYVNRDGPAGIVERLSILDRDGRVRRPPQTLTGLFNHFRRDIGGQHRSTWADGIKRRLGGDARPTRHIKYAMTGCKPRRTKHEWKEVG